MVILTPPVSYPRSRIESNANYVANLYIGPMPLDQFLQHFVPPAVEARPKGNIDFKNTKSLGTYRKLFAKAVNTARLCPGFVFFDTSSVGNRIFCNNGYPDIIAVSSGNIGNKSPPKEFQWTAAELYFEVLPDDLDPFSDPSADTVDRKKHDFLSRSGMAEHARTYAVADAYTQHCTQFRTFTFSVFLMGSYARIMHWDRSGAVVTERFEWKKDRSTLAEFLWRFAHLDASQRGRDTSVTAASADEGRAARRALLRGGHYPKGLPDDCQLYKYHIRDDKTGKDHYFVGPFPTSRGEKLIGRATMGFVVFDLCRRVCVWLKDAWRIDVPFLEKEGDIYRLLHAKEVPNIPGLVCAGEVQTGGVSQKARARDLAQEEWACGPAVRHDALTHYRLVLDTVGRILETFTNTKELCRALRDAILAHSKAFTSARVLHRDISAGNVLITPSGKGILIDWEMSCIVSSDSTPDDCDNSGHLGTWEFISAKRLIHPKRRHEYSDDLEAFLHVLIFILLTCRRTTFDNLELKFDDFFYGEHPPAGDRKSSGKAKRRFFRGKVFCNHEWHASLTEPCAGLLEAFRSLFKPLYTKKREGRAAAATGIQTADAALAIFDQQLESEFWATDDRNEFGTRPWPDPVPRKRERCESGGEPEAKRQRVE